MESEEEYIWDRINFLKIVVDTGVDYPEYDNSFEDFSISSFDFSSNDLDLDEVSKNPEDIEDQNLIFYDRQEKNDRQNFIDMFKDKHSYPKSSSIADSKNLLWKRKKIYAVWALQYYNKLIILNVKMERGLGRDLEFSLGQMEDNIVKSA